ncbi:MAG: PAS domain S-box protein [Thermodesulfobacteriota bacterium]
MPRPGEPFSARIRRLLLFFGLVVFAAVFAVGALYEGLALRRELARIMEGLAVTSGSLLRDSILQHRRAIEEIVAAVPEGCSDAELGRHFADNLPMLGPEDSYFVLNSAGRVIHASRRAGDFIGLDFSHLPFVAKGGGISGVHQSLATLKPVVTIKYPLPGGRLMLVERDLFSLPPLLGHLKLTGPVREGFFFVLSENGTVVYHPEARLMANRYPLGFELRHWSGADAYGLREYTYRGVRYLCLRQPLALPEGWVFYAAVPQHEFVRVVTTHLGYLAVAIALLLGGMALLLHFLISRELSRPIQRIAARLSRFNPLEEEMVADAAGTAGEAAELQQIVAACGRLAANVRAANERLRESELLFRTVTEFASDWSYWLDPEQNFIYVSPACEALTGYTADEFYARPALLEEIIHPEDRATCHEHIRQAVRDQPHEPIEFRIVAKDGSVRWLTHVCRPIRDSEGHFLGVRGSNSDISGRKQAELALAAEKELLAVTLRSIGDGVVTVDVEGRVLMLSRMAERLTGWSEKEALGRRLDEVLRLVEPGTEQARESPLAKVLATGQIAMSAAETVLVAKDGSKRLVADSGAPIFDRASRVIGAVVVFRDITEQHRLEQELYKAHKLESLGVLAGGIAHDFNNLLTAIIGNLSLTRLQIDDPSLRRQVDAANKAALRAQGLTQQLLTFAKGGAPIKAVTSLADLVREAAEFSLHGAKARYRVESAADLWAVEVDPAQMSQVVNNLILNADQAMPGGGTITVTLANRQLDGELGLAPGPYVEIRVADQGHGIAPDHLERIFDPYFSTKQAGSGLGLASSYSIVKRHGGHISVASRPGEGAVFTVYLPARPGAVAEPAAEAGQPLPGRGRVLVLDDEEMVRELAQAVLERLGYEADCAEEGGQVLAMYQAAREAGRPYDVVIMDLTIPGGMGGQEAMRELLRIDPAAKGVVSSGYAQDPVMANYRDYGFVAVLAKPYSLEALSRVLHDLVVAGRP